MTTFFHNQFARNHWLDVAVIAALALLYRPLPGAAQDTNANDMKSVLGRWDVVVQGKDGPYPSWFEIRLSGSRTLVGSYVGQFGSARPISKVELHNGAIGFTVPPQWERRETDVTYVGKVDGEVIRGETTDDKGEHIHWEARRAP